MQSALSMLLQRLTERFIKETKIIRWGAPVPAFGDLSRSMVASLGLNPSNLEFVDMHGRELEGECRRFHTLRSLGIEHWSEAHEGHYQQIIESCRTYFANNPYDRWFRKLDEIVSGTTASYYGGTPMACHMDLIPFATSCKWTDLTHSQRVSLLAVSGDTLGLLLRDSPVRVLILNGSSVIRHFESIAGVVLERRLMPSWALPRKSGPVAGFAYSGSATSVFGIKLGRELMVLGFNHNIQSSFGVTTEVKLSIRRWIAGKTQRVLV